MKKLITRTLAPALTACLFASTAWAYNGQTLPNPDATECRKNVIQPNHPLDNGFLTDANCTTIFVLPPRKGNLQITNIAPNMSLKLCPTVNKKFANMDQISGLQGKLISELGNASIERQTEIGAAISNLDTLESTVAQSMLKWGEAEGLTAQALLEIQWANLVAAYAKSNRDLAFGDETSIPMNVQALPLVGSFFSATVVTKDKNRAEAEGYDFQALISSQIPGILSIPNDISFATSNPNEPTYSFGSSMSGQIKLSVIGSCPFYNSRNESYILKPNRMTSLAAHMVANMTYFYRTETASGYSIDFDAEMVADALKKHFDRKGTISSEKVIQDILSLEGSNAIKIEIHNSSATSFDPNEVRNRVTESFVYGLLNKFAVPVGNIPAVEKVSMPSDPHHIQTRTRRVCKRRYHFGIIAGSKSCYDQRYKARVNVDGRTTSVVDYLRDLKVRYSEDVTIFDTVIQAGTLGFVDTSSN